MVSCGEMQAVAAEVEIAGGVFQFELVEFFNRVRFPKEEIAPISTGSGDADPVGMDGNTPGDATKFGLGEMFDLLLATLPVEDDDRGIADTGKGVGNVRDAAAGDIFPVGTEGHTTKSTDDSPESLVVFLE